jgi:hypothetical protein
MSRHQAASPPRPSHFALAPLARPAHSGGRAAGTARTRAGGLQDASPRLLGVEATHKRVGHRAAPVLLRALVSLAVLALFAPVHAEDCYPETPGVAKPRGANGRPAVPKAASATRVAHTQKRPKRKRASVAAKPVSNDAGPVKIACTKKDVTPPAAPFSAPVTLSSQDPSSPGPRARVGFSLPPLASKAPLAVAGAGWPFLPPGSAFLPGGRGSLPVIGPFSAAPVALAPSAGSQPPRNESGIFPTPGNTPPSGGGGAALPPFVDKDGPTETNPPPLPDTHGNWPDAPATVPLPGPIALLLAGAAGLVAAGGRMRRR